MSALRAGRDDISQGGVRPRPNDTSGRYIAHSKLPRRVFVYSSPGHRFAAAATAFDKWSGAAVERRPARRPQPDRDAPALTYYALPVSPALSPPCWTVLTPGRRSYVLARRGRLAKSSSLTFLLDAALKILSNEDVASAGWRQTPPAE